MSSKIGSYDHLGTELSLGVSFDTLADTLVRTNYGVHRICSAIVRAYHRRNAATYICPDVEKNIKFKIEQLLEDGYF